MPNVNRKADAFITMAIDAQAGRTMVTGWLCSNSDPEKQVRSFSGLVNEVDLVRRLPEWLAELRAA